MLLSSSQLNVARGMNKSRLSRSAITSYLRGSFLSKEPSPNQPPASMPVNVTILPSGETLHILSSPSPTPIQWSTGSPLRHTKPPSGTTCSSMSASTFCIWVGVSVCAQMVWRNSARELERVIGMVQRNIES